MENNLTLPQKYYPTEFSQLYLPDRIKDLIAKNKDRKGYRLLFMDQQGTGKSSTARLITPKDKFEVLFKSGSNDFSIQTLREIYLSIYHITTHIL